MREREVKLGVPPEFVSPPVLADDGVRTVPLEPRQYDTVYMDTPDLRLARWGLQLRHRSDEGWTVKLPSDGSGPVLDRLEIQFRGSPGAPPPEALDLIRAFSRGVPVEPSARTRTTRLRSELRDDAGATLGEIAVDDVTVQDAEGFGEGFREVEVEIAEDVPVRTLHRVVAALRDAGAGQPDSTSKYVRALGGRAPSRPGLSAGAPPPEALVAEVVRFALSSSVARLLRFDPGVRLGDDPEAVHQARVATRRLRSDLRTFGPLLDPEWAKDLRDGLRWLGWLFGAARDADVLLMRLRRRLEDLRDDDRSRAEELLIELTWAGERARQDLLAAMRSDRYVALLDRLIEGTDAPRLDPDAGDGPADRWLRPLLRVPWARLSASVSALGDEPKDAELHEIRIETKRCRYAAEATAPVIGKQARRFAEAAAGLQDVLGEHQDSVVARRWLRRHGIESGGSFAYVAGELAAAEAEAARQARARWPSAWKRVAGAAARMGL